jgi:hypothetical protein
MKLLNKELIKEKVYINKINILLKNLTKEDKINYLNKWIDYILNPNTTCGCFGCYKSELNNVEYHYMDKIYESFEDNMKKYDNSFYKKVILELEILSRE